MIRRAFFPGFCLQINFAFFSFVVVIVVFGECYKHRAKNVTLYLVNRQHKIGRIFLSIPLRIILWLKKSYRHNRCSLSTNFYKTSLCLSRVLLCSDRVMFSLNTGAQGACEGSIKKKKRGTMRGDSRANRL